MGEVFYPLERGFIVTSPYGDRWGTVHLGTDFGKEGGSGGLPVYAVKDGTVTHAGRADGFGQWVVVDHPAENGGGTTVYGHVIPEVGVGARVSGGQRIAHINPTKGPGNGNVDPHVHLEWHRYAWSPNARDRLDPMPFLEGASYPNEVPEPTPGRPPVLDESVEWYGIDISSWQAGLDLRRVKDEGFNYVIAKASQGNWYTNPEYAAQKRGARDNGLLFMAYHYVSGSDSAASQVDRFESVESDKSIRVMVDHENGSGDINMLRSVVGEFKRRGWVVALTYVPGWYWRGTMGSPDLSGLPPLMASDYILTSPGFASELYKQGVKWSRDNGHVDHKGWNGYGGNSVGLLQFTEKGRVAGQLVDCCIFRGTFNELGALFGVSEIEVIMGAADKALTERHASRSIYRTSADAIDDLGGYILNIDARIHEQFVEEQAAKGVPEYVETVRRVAADGMVGAGTRDAEDSKLRAAAALREIGGK